MARGQGRGRPAPSKTSDEGALERPSKVGEHYEVIRKIGEGSFGVIYLGMWVWRAAALADAPAPGVGRTDLCPDLVAVKFVSATAGLRSPAVC